MKKTLLVLLALIFTAGSAMAGNVDTYGIGARAQSLGGAYAATADDPYAAYYNPAGLTQIKGLTMSAGVVMADPSLQAKGYRVKYDNTSAPGIQDMGPTDIQDKTDILMIPSMGGAMPLTDNIVVGMAVYAPFGLQIEWEENAFDNPGAFDTYYSGIMREVVTPTIAFKLNDMFSFGAGISLGKSKSFQKMQNYGLSVGVGGGELGLGPYENPVLINVELEDDFNWSFNLGVMCNVSDDFTLGLTYRGRTSVKQTGTMSFGGPGAALLNLAGVAPDISMDDVDFPEQVQIGARFKPKGNLSLEADLVWTNWSVVESQTLIIDSPPSIMVPGLVNGNALINARNWVNTVQVKCGAEWQVNDMLALRVGYYFDPSPIPDATFDIPWPDADKNNFSIGFGLNFLEHWTLDTVLQYTYTIRDRNIGGESEVLNHVYAYPGYHGEAEATASGSIWIGGFTVSCTF
ncbi:MAG: hypothetical protein B6I31_02120 [Desulfobacteraceae bacterium 4572_19]|nr:MAG: hypothetical protein B6I31_02120 [Desulfobacteraceae bacterium 4572_19]